MTPRIAIGALAGLLLSTGAFAQSYNAPAGIPAATAPGGLEGQAGPANLAEYYRSHGGPAGPGVVTVEGVYTTGSVYGAPAGYGRRIR